MQLFKKQGWIFALAVLLGSFLTACEELSNPIGSDKRIQNDEEIRAYIASNSLSTKSTEEGLYYQVVSKGASGQKPEAGDEIKVNYLIRRLDGVIVDSSQLKRNIPVEAKYRISRLPYLSDEAMALLFGSPLLTEGDSAILLVPSHLGQGVEGTLLFPAYSPARIDIKVVSINTEKEQIELFIEENGFNITETTESGLYFGRTLVQSDSALLKAGDKVQVRYIGRFLNNTIFDSGTLTETIGAESSPVKGFAEGIAKMRVGEKANLIFPSELGYGPQGNTRGQVRIPGFAPLYFEVEILSKTQ